MIRILATKKLTKNQKSILNNANIAFECSNFIETKGIQFEMDLLHDFLIFSSKNAVKSILKKNNLAVFEKKCFCVGSKTKTYLEKKGFSVVASANNAKELIAIIEAQFARCSATFFCGTKRKNTIPDYFYSNKLVFNEVIVYETLLKPKAISGVFDGILFFSPSAVSSYLQSNSIENEICFCIGETTKEALPIHALKQCKLPEQPTIEAVIDSVISFFKP